MKGRRAGREAAVPYTRPSALRAARSAGLLARRNRSVWLMRSRPSVVTITGPLCCVTLVRGTASADRARLRTPVADADGVEAVVGEALGERMRVRERSGGVFVIPHREQHGPSQPWRSLARQRNSWCDVKPSQARNVDWSRSAPERPKRRTDADVGDVDRGDHRTIIDRRGACGQSRTRPPPRVVWPPRTAHRRAGKFDELLHSYTPTDLPPRRTGQSGAFPVRRC